MDCGIGFLAAENVFISWLHSQLIIVKVNKITSAEQRQTLSARTMEESNPPQSVVILGAGTQGRRLAYMVRPSSQVIHANICSGQAAETPSTSWIW